MDPEEGSEGVGPRVPESFLGDLGGSPVVVQGIVIGAMDFLRGPKDSWGGLGGGSWEFL